MNQELMQYGVAVVVIVVVLRLVLDFLLTLKNQKNGSAIGSIIPGVSEHCRRCDARLDGMSRKMDKLWEIHDKYNDDGSPKWFVPTTMLGSIHTDLQAQHKCQKELLALLNSSHVVSKEHNKEAKERHEKLVGLLEKNIKKSDDLMRAWEK